MAEPFDPYLKWLGIPPRQQPPNAYRLLGIELYESDADVISNAADQRMAHVRNFAGGEHSALSQKILNEIAETRVRLLNAETKAAYDRTLRAQLNKPKRPAVRKPAQAKPWTPPAVAADLPVATRPPAAQVGPTIDIGEKAASKASRRRLHMIIGGSLLALGLALVLFFVFGGGDDSGDQLTGLHDNGGDSTGTNGGENGRNQTPAGHSGPTQPPDGTNPTTNGNRPPKDPEDPPTPPVVKPAEDRDNASLVLVWPNGVPRQAALMIDNKPVAVSTTGEQKFSLRPGSHVLTLACPGYKTARFPLVLRPRQNFRLNLSLNRSTSPEPPAIAHVDPDQGDPDHTNPAPSNGNPITDPVEPQPIEKIAPPDVATKRSVERELRELYADGFELATHARGKVHLAKQMRRDGEETKDDPVGRFVLFETALKLATEAAEIDEAMTIIDRIDALYMVDGLEMKTKTLETVGRAVSAGPAATGQHDRIVELAEQLRTEAMAQADVPSAIRFVQVSLSAMRKLKDTQKQADLRETLDELNALRSQGDLVQKAIEALERTPEHPKANEVAGCWYCFIVGNWEKGLPWLAKAEDPALADLAKQDMAEPSKATEQATMGDRWFDLSETKKGLESDRLQTRAAYWYKRALPKLSGLPARRLEKRLAEMGTSLGNYSLEFDGRKSHLVVPNFGIGMNVPITVEALVMPETASSGVRTTSSSSCRAILSNINTPGEAGLCLERYSSSGWAFRFYTFQQSGSSVYEHLERAYCSTTSTSSNEWVHVAGVFDGSQIRLYVDGQLKDTETISGMHNPSRLPLMIGASPTGYMRTAMGPTEFFNGRIKAVRISQQALYTTSFDPPEELRHQGRATAMQFTFDAGSGSQIKSGKHIATVHDAEWVDPSEVPTPVVPTPKRSTPTRPPIPGARLR